MKNLNFSIFIGVVSVLISLGANSQTNNSQTNNSQKLVPIYFLLLDDDENCNDLIVPVSVGDTVIDKLSTDCQSSTQNAYAGYYSFNHTGGKIHIDLLSDYPNGYNPYLILRAGQTTNGAFMAQDDNGHDDFNSARITMSNLPAGQYTIEVTASNVLIEGSYVMSIYSDLVTAYTTNKLNDTGQTKSKSGANMDLDTTCANVNQDCGYGRDADSIVGYASSTSVSNSANDNDGHAGFSFMKVSSQGAPLPTSAASWSCVKDNVTGLMWEAKTTSSTNLHYRDKAFTWYSTDTSNNGSSTTPPAANGVTNNGCGSPPCNTHTFVNAVNSQGLCGYSDWRLPTMTELLSIYNYYEEVAYQPVGFDSNFFPNMTTSDHLWTSTPHSSNTAKAMSIYSGFIFNEGMFEEYSARLVRSEP